jgi:hypothetical protein
MLVIRPETSPLRRPMVDLSLTQRSQVPRFWIEARLATSAGFPPTSALSTSLLTWNENRTEKQILTSRDLMVI